MKKCYVCSSLKSLDNFTKNKYGKDGLSYECKQCKKSYQERYRKNTKHKQNRKEYCKQPVNKQKVKEKIFFKLYGITWEERNQILIYQNHKCAICSVDELEAGKKGLVMDHNHMTGEPRALLCNNCNRGIGYLKDSIEICKKASEYLDSFEEKSNIVQILREKESKRYENK